MKKLITFFYIFTAAFFLLLVSGCQAPNANRDTFSGDYPVIESLPLWRGFNLQNMFSRGTRYDTNFNEKDFRTISEWGFNFVRIPVDYRILISGGNWNNINENALQRLDKAVEFGMKYNIHVNINFHRAPGFTVASPAETTDLWTQRGPQEAFARLWGILAERYKNISNEFLSFNLVNEPPAVDEAVHAAVMKKAADAIRAKDPKRLIIADGREFGYRPSTMIRDLGIVQSTRGYYPNTVSHYGAEWMEGSSNYPAPAWPVIMVPRYLYALEKTDVPRSVYSIRFNFNEAYNLDINVGVVSREARLIVKADDRIIYNNLIVSGPGNGDWTTVVFRQDWNVYQNIFNRDYRALVPSGARHITIEVTDGDWMTVNDIKFSPVRTGSGRNFSLTPNSIDWGREIPPVVFDSNGNPDAGASDSFLWEIAYKHWEEFINNGGVMVGEWGAYNKTPHDVTLRWMEDNLKLFKERGLAWALWNFNGPFGIVDSGRTDVQYEDYDGYKLDRKMLELLQKY